MKKKYLIRRGIVGLVVLFFLLFLVFVLLNKKEEKIIGKMNYVYESRIEDVKTFDSGGIQKYGWLQVQGTNIDVPILSGWSNDTNDIKYSYGWLVSPSFGYDTRLVLAGHNVLNVSPTPMVNDPRLSDFEDLMSFSYYSFAKDNQYLVYTEFGKDEVYVIYGIGFYDYEYIYDTKGLDRNEVEKYIEYVKENSIYDYGVDVNKDDDIITIKTCTRMFGANEKQQLIIDARLLRKDEEMYKYSVKKTKLYKKYNLKDKYSNNFS